MLGGRRDSVIRAGWVVLLFPVFWQLHFRPVRNILATLDVPDISLVVVDAELFHEAVELIVFERRLHAAILLAETLHLED